MNKDEPVAYLAPIGPQPTPLAMANAAEVHELRRAFADVGLTLSLEDARAGALPKPTPTPTPPGDGRTDVVTVGAMRTGRDW